MKESDNNVKLIVLDRLLGLKENPAHERVLQVEITLVSIMVPALGCCTVGVL